MSSKKPSKFSKNNFKNELNSLTKINYQAEELLRKNPEKFWSSKISDDVKLTVIKEIIANLIIDCDNPDDFRIKVLKEIARDYQK